ncbi:MAG: hypothetical protein KKH11_00695, partial [Candidatus Omnitrophica bacterium]|nr:hypothetical protein [Candidatus Omnitrophota bacterium]
LTNQLSKKVGQVQLPKLGEVRFTKTREIKGRIRHITISKTCQKNLLDGKGICGILIMHSRGLLS